MKKVSKLILTSLFLVTLLLSTSLTAFASEIDLKAKETEPTSEIVPMVQLYELTFVEHKFQSLPYILKWDGMEAGSVTLLINYDKYQTWMVDEFGNKRYLLSESRVITNADYTGFKLLVKFTGQV